ncbi:aldo/keto reductase [Gemmobacter aquarius]|uniref:Aldo/keto reductase n=1 Tax=Paragemmobacter aquarius TaxID=2169400 RepID=A0A2S0UQR4_9RHOB|nr:aldo/keto reductase [Gemmobacter aquarius]AWB50145.1 aldo/keto reductase [Gemmobacter aquarius]
MTLPLPHRAAFGCMQFGGRADDSASRAMFDACLDAGITHFDTAHGYTEGASETLLGQFAAPLRDRLFIATKAGYQGGAGRANLLAQFDESRKRLGMDTVDLLYIHRYDADTPLDETIQTLARLQSDGKIRQIGLSNFAAWQVMKAQAIAARLGTRIDAIQPMYNLVKRQAQVELLPMCADQSIAVYGYSPLGGGLLTGKYAAGSAGRLTEDQRYAARYGQPEMHRAAADLAVLADEVAINAVTLAVAWVMRRGLCPILSARSADQLAPSLAALTFTPDDALDSRLTALAPNPPPATDRLEEA